MYKRIIDKLHEDYFKASRLCEYRDVLCYAKENGYKMMGVADFFKEVCVNGEKEEFKEKKVLLNRHDIDTSPKVARKMFEIEQEVYGKDGGATYYFRDITVDIDLIKEIDAYGYETGYHYEEIARFAKHNKIKDKSLIIDYIDEIKKMFMKDLANFRQNTTSPSITVASHGDFVNVKLDFSNTEILKNDDGLREQYKIFVEAYDRSMMDYIEARFADQVLLTDFKRCVIDSINSGCKHIMILTHPRNWEVDIIANTEENLRRLKQGISYKI